MCLSSFWISITGLFQFWCFQFPLVSDIHFGEFQNAFTPPSKCVFWEVSDVPSPWCGVSSSWRSAGCVWDASCSTHHSCVFVFLSESLIGRRLQRNTCSVRSGSFSAFSFSSCCCWGQKTLRMMDYKACESKSRNWRTDAVLELQMCAVEPLHSSALTQMCSSTLTVD